MSNAENRAALKCVVLMKKINISCLGILLRKAISTPAEKALSGGSTVNEVSHHIVAGGELVANDKTCVLPLGPSQGIYGWHG